jgi:hypothetical protein
LVTSLAPGQVGCLRKGTYLGPLTFVRGGEPRRPIVFRSFPGERATVRGYVYVPDSSNFVRISDLAVDGSTTQQQTVQIFGDDVTLSNVDVTNRNQGGSCIHLGDHDFGFALRTIVRESRVHDCGETAGQDHGIYLSATRGARILRSYIYGASGWGIHLYPDARSTVITQNVLYGNRSGNIIFAGDEHEASSGTRATLNILSNPGSGFNLDASWVDPVGTDNVAARNCLWSVTGRNVSEQNGFVADGNIIGNPRFAAPSKGDFRQRAGGACKRLRELSP